MNKYYNAADPFWGNGGTTVPAGEGMASNWNWLKAQTGNTHPGALMPFGWVSVLPYSGAYPTGYGKTGVSSDGAPPEIFDRKAAWGFTHFHNSGVGFIGYFYNYLLITPYTKGANTAHISDLDNETARPGYFSGTLSDYGVDFELTADKYAACHKYKFNSAESFIDLDATQLGFRAPCHNNYHEKINELDFRRTSENSWHGAVSANGCTIFFSFILNGKIRKSAIYNGKLEIALESDSAESFLGFSLNSVEEADERAAAAKNKGFDNVKDHAAAEWENALSTIKAGFANETEEKIFYSAFYHSMIKPVDAGSEFTDFQTMWDIYHCQLPLMLTTQSKTARKMLLSMMDTIEKLKFFPIGYLMTNDYYHDDNQATALAIYTLADGFFCNLLTVNDYPRLKKCFELELAHANVENKSPTHLLDLAGALNAAALVAGKCGDNEFADSLNQRKNIWKNAYDSDTGLMRENAVYYEGSHWNYSFRAHPGMAERIALAGGKEKFTALLDTFFGADIPPCNDGKRIIRENFFEGMNNESDMDSPYTYLWTGRSDRTSEIISLIRKYRYSTGDGGAPGNNDSGALSSWYVWNALGLYPCSGTGMILLGSPSVENAEVILPDATLKIEVSRESKNAIYPVKYRFNGKIFTEPFLPVNELYKGGTLEFFLENTPNNNSPIPSWL